MLGIVSLMHVHVCVCAHTQCAPLLLPPLSSSLRTCLGCVATGLPIAPWDMESSVL